MKSERPCQYCGEPTQSIKDKEGKYTCVGCINAKFWMKNNPSAREKILMELKCEGEKNDK